MPFFRQCSENDLRSTHSTREEKNSVVLCPNGQFRALEKPPFWPSFSTGALSFRECPFFWRAASSGGLRDDTAAGNVASLTFTRKCLLRASDCGCGIGLLFSRIPRPVLQSFQSALAWFQSALAWFRLLRASDCTLQLGWWSVASLTFTRKCLLRASECKSGNGFLFSRRPRPVVSQSLQSALAWFQSALAWFRLLRASDCRCGNGVL